MAPFALGTLGLSLDRDAGDRAAGSSQAILGLSNLRSPLWGTARENYAEFSFLDLAYGEGYRVMDTAAIYGLGGSEKTLGHWMDLRRNRHEIAVITKGGHPSLLPPGRHRLTAEQLDQDLRASLRRLRTDYIDVYMLHRDAQDCDLSAVMQFLDEQTRRGTIRALGASNWLHTRIEEANALAGRLGLTPFSVSSPQVSLLSWTRPPWRGVVSIAGRQGAEARTWYRDAKQPVFAWSPFGGGLSERAGTGWTATGKCYDSRGNTSRLTRAAAVAQQRGMTVPGVLLAYLASLPCLVHPVCASRSRAHLRSNREALSVKLSDAELRTLEDD